MADPRVWLVGETNPYQDDPEDSIRYAMYPEPEESAGGRLCNLILGMHQRDYLRSFERRNLLAGPWEGKGVRERARASAACLSWEMSEGDVVLMLGKKVFDSFFPGEVWLLFDVHQRCGRRHLVLPHPSGLNRFWNEFLSYAHVRTFLAKHAPHLAPLLGRSLLTRGRTAAEREVVRVG